MRRQFALWVTAILLLALPGTAGAYVIQDFTLPSATNGIALGADGNFWVSEEFAGTVARMTPAGQVIGRFDVGSGAAARPASITAGADGTVWVSVPNEKVLTRIDTKPATPSVQKIDTSTSAGCGPVGVAHGGTRVYVTFPSDGGCGASRIGSIDASGTGAISTVITSGPAFDLAVAGGKVYVPIYDGDLVQRFNASLVSETTAAVDGAPDGIAIDAQGVAWVSQNATGRVARISAGQNGGAGQSFAPTGGPLDAPFGVAAAGDGRVYVASNKGIARVSADGTMKLFPTSDGEPFDIAAGPDGDVYFTDRVIGRVRRLVSSAPRITGGAGTATATTSANVSANIDARGNTTTVTFEYGPTTAYGAAVTVPANGVGPFPIGATLTGLAAGTTYHFRVRAINEEGEATPGGDLTFATPAPPVVTPTLKARANFSWGFTGSRTVLTRVRVSDLSGGETIKITCSGKGKGCPLKTKTYKSVKKGTRTLTTLFGKKKLKTGAKIVVTITKPGAIGSTTTVTIGKRKKDPKIVRKPLKP